MIDLTPEEFRALGYRAVDIIAERMAQQASAATRQPVPQALRDDLMHAPLGEAATTPDTVLERVAADILPYPMGNNSPRFFAWVNSPAAPLGVLAELLAAAHNASVAGGDHSATYVEHGVLNWVKAWFGYPQDAGGLLVSGGSVANIIGLAAMRHAQTRGGSRTQGLHAWRQMVVYTSDQGHSCLQKAVELLGIGSDNLRHIPTDDAYRLDVLALRAQIAQDRAAGLWPVCVAASAGTVNTGAIDPLGEIAQVCQQEGLWLHVDGAYGGVGILAAAVSDLYSGIEQADSIAVDPHKWLYQPIECGLVLVRDAAALQDTFSVMPAYLRDDRALPWFSEFGIQQTRGFRALKLWMVLQQVGLAGLRDLIGADIERSRQLRAKIAAHPSFELVAGGPLSICAFACVPPAPTDAMHTDMERLHREMAAAVQASGAAFITTTVLRGRTVLRACIVNFRTTEADLDRLLAALEAARSGLLRA